MLVGVLLRADRARRARSAASGPSVPALPAVRPGGLVHPGVAHARRVSPAPPDRRTGLRDRMDDPGAGLVAARVAPHGVRHERAIFCRARGGRDRTRRWFQIRYDTVAAAVAAGSTRVPAPAQSGAGQRRRPDLPREGIVPTYIHAYWYGALQGVPVDRSSDCHPISGRRLARSFLCSVTDCTPCEQLAEGGFYRLLRVP
jgi:hypothetical protein